MINPLLEAAASVCMAKAKGANNLWKAMHYQDCALAIRSLPEWLVAKDNETSVVERSIKERGVE